MSEPTENKIQYALSWNEYGELIDDLWNDLQAKLDKHDIKIDAIIPILREGGFTGLPLAYKLNTYKIIPIQFKYMLYDGSSELKQVSKIPDIMFDVPQSPTFLLCDTFPTGGKTKTRVIEEFKQKYPTVKFVFASLIEDRTTKDIPDILFNAFAVPVDENWVTNHRIYEAAGVTNVLYTLLPWENEQEELAGPDLKKFNYN